MSNWSMYKESDEEWDKIVIGSGQNCYQNYSFYSNLRVALRWNVHRFICYGVDLNVNAILVAYSRTLFGVRIFWSPAGFSNLAAQNYEIVISSFKIFIGRNFKHFIFKMGNTEEFSPEKDFILHSHFIRSSFRLSSGYTVINDLSLSRKDILSMMSAKRRYTLNRSLKSGLVWDMGNDDQVLRSFENCLNLFRLEGVRNFKLPSRSELYMMRDNPDHFIFIVGFLSGETVSCAVLNVADHRAFYLYSATTKAGRAVGAAYSMIFESFEFLRLKGCEEFDLLGISPSDSEIDGINKFKFAFKGRIVKYLGEFQFGRRYLIFFEDLVKIFLR